MIFQFATALGAWLILMLVTTNLIGFSIRGLFTNPDMARLAGGSNDTAKMLAQQHLRMEKKTSFIALILTAAFLLALYYFWNLGVVIAALMLMLARLPDLLFEMKLGRKMQKGDMQRAPFHLMSTVLSWGSLPVLWFALYGR